MIARLLRRYALPTVAIAGAAFAGFSLAQPVNNGANGQGGGPAILDSDEKNLFPGLKDAADISDQAAGILGGKDFKLVKVEAIDGQNPFDAIEPFFNFNGVRVQNFAELLALLLGDDDDDNNNNNGFAGCLGAFNSGLVVIGGFTAGELSTVVDVPNQLCRFLQNTEGNAFGMILFDGDASISIFGLGNFDLLQPPGGVNASLGNGLATIQVRDRATGDILTFRVNIVINSQSPPSFTMNVLEISLE